MKETILTKNALEIVKKELDDLIAKRKEISEEIKKAREFGDLSENAEYHAAREAQTQNEDEIMKLKNIIETATIVDENQYGENKVSMNTKVKIKYVKEKLESVVQIVSTIESDPFNDLLSNESPIGKELLGKSEGETVEVVTPNGPVKIKILEIIK
jgi:transcription elongation factor GreA